MEYNENFSIDYSLEGKNAIVTGAASGIGEAIAVLYAKKGANLVLCDISEDVKSTQDRIGEWRGKTAVCVGDVTKSEVRDAIVKTARETLGGIDILVNVAGVALLDNAENLSEEYWDKTLDLNLTAAFMLAQNAGNYMIKNGGGKIINLASQASVIALERHVAYCASKAALVSVTQVLAVEWAKYNINVNAISPTVVLTELGKKAWAGDAGEEMKKLIPARRFGYPSEVAATAVFLASDAANLITGANIIIDGGYTVK
jgi:NAD(P)-dependent dehydrogenase (short-subunit alcohol dehydrogenase family)